MRQIDIYHDLPSNRPLQNAWQHVTMPVALLGNVEGRNGQFRNGGHCKAGWLDTHKTQTAKPPVPVCFQASGRENARAVCGASQQSARDVNRTVQNATRRGDSLIVFVLPVASGLVDLQPTYPDAYLRRSIESRHAYYSTGYGGLERALPMKHLLIVLAIEHYLFCIGVSVLLDKHYASVGEAVQA